MIETAERSEHRTVSQISDYQRGWLDGTRSLTKAVVAAMAPTRKGGVLRIDIHRFDSIVERHLSEVGIPRGPDGDWNDLSEVEIPDDPDDLDSDWNEVL